MIYFNSYRRTSNHNAEIACMFHHMAPQMIVIQGKYHFFPMNWHKPFMINVQFLAMWAGRTGTGRSHFLYPWWSLVAWVGGVEHNHYQPAQRSLLANSCHLLHCTTQILLDQYELHWFNGFCQLLISRYLYLQDLHDLNLNCKFCLEISLILHILLGQ